MIHRRSVLASLCLAPMAFSARAQTPPPAAPAPVSLKFDFRKAAPGAQFVAPGTVFSAERGYGFEPVESGPPIFSAVVPEGNYRVTVELGGAGASDTTIKAESRRLMVHNAKTTGNTVRREVFIVNVRRSTLKAPPVNSPGFDTVATNKWEVGSFTWDDRLTLEFSGPAPAVSTVQIESVTVPTVFLAGDSTVTDQRWEPYGSWGQFLPYFFKPDIAVANHAESGETVKSFIGGRRLDKILSQIKPGDFLLMQFGHNDSQRSWPHTYVDPATTYREYLRAYVAEAKSRNATPVLVTQMQKRVFDEAGKVRNSVGEYPNGMRAVAKDTNTALVELNTRSVTFYEALGVQGSIPAFAAGGRDVTHTTSLGAYGLARCVVEGIRESVPDLAAHLRTDIGRFDPANPGLEGFTLPVSRTKPAGLP